MQALSLLNSEFAIGRAKVLADRIVREGGEDTDQRIRSAYQLVLAREPKQAEIERSRSFVKAAEQSAWVDFALALLNCNEFLYVP